MSTSLSKKGIRDISYWFFGGVFPHPHIMVYIWGQARQLGVEDVEWELVHIFVQPHKRGKEKRKMFHSHLKIGSKNSFYLLSCLDVQGILSLSLLEIRIVESDSWWLSVGFRHVQLWASSSGPFKKQAWTR